MRLYIYHNTNDSTKESHGKIEAINLEDAIKIASHMKQLEVNEFLKLFTVEEYGKK
jgi:urease beta subunit